MSLLLISTYESGFYPIATLEAGSYCKEKNVSFNIIDLSVQKLPSFSDLLSYEYIGFHLPMFHSVPLAIKIVSELIAQKQQQSPRFFFFGLYSEIFRDKLLKFSELILGAEWQDKFIDIINGLEYITARSNNYFSGINLPLTKVKDDDGHVYVTGEPLEICNKTKDVLNHPLYKQLFSIMNKSGDRDVNSQTTTCCGEGCC
jgi:hypothetical protein